MKTAVFTLVFALFSTTMAQEKFRCRCADGSNQNINGIESLCKSKGGEAERPDLCIKAKSRFSDTDCATVQQGAKGDCIVDTISDQTGSSSLATATVAATAAPRAVREAPWQG